MNIRVYLQWQNFLKKIQIITGIVIIHLFEVIISWLMFKQLLKKYFPFKVWNYSIWVYLFLLKTTKSILFCHIIG